MATQSFFILFVLSTKIKKGCVGLAFKLCKQADERLITCAVGVVMCAGIRAVGLL